jgi:alpha-ketoglutarate-dependent taurine dioxygenase
MDDFPITSPDFIDAFNKEKIEPWDTIIHFDKITLETEQLGGLETQKALTLLERYGICILRLHGHAPDEPTFRAFFESLGQVMDEQNLFKGDVKDIRPEADIAPITGSSKGDLGFHVDGTQTKDQPALLAFQYVKPADVGGNSRFVDLAAVLFSLSTKDYERVLTNLSRPDAAIFRKDGRELLSPIFHMPDDESLACRIRVDGVIELNPECQADYEILRNILINDDYGIKFKPIAGDIIVFDNWRVLHARDTVLGYNQRHHRRVWMEALLKRYQPQYRLGIRPLSLKLKAKILENNGK